MLIARRKVQGSRLLIAAAAVCSLAGLPGGAADGPVSLLWPQPREVRGAGDSQIRLPIRIIAPAELAAQAALLQREVDTIFGPSQLSPARARRPFSGFR